jgi:hypothetical protein
VPWLSADGRGDVRLSLICTSMKCSECPSPERVRSDTADHPVAGNSTDLSIEARPTRPTALPIDLMSTSGDVTK